MIRWLFLSTGVLGLSPRTHAQIAPRLDPLPVVWFQRGTTNELTVSGDGIQPGAIVQFTGSGITGSLQLPTSTNLTIEASGSGLSASPPAASAKSTALRLVLAANTPLGAQEMRILGPNGVSNGQQLNVSDLVEVREQEPNDTPERAQRLDLPRAVSGVIRQSAGADYFKFHARAGEHVILDVQANRTGSPLDASIEVFDSTGREVARSEDVHGLDPFLDFTPPAEGDFVLKLHDLRFQGGDAYRYRLVAGVVPYLERLFPFGGQRGTTVEVQLAGQNLEGADRLSLSIAAGTPTGRQDIRAKTAAGSSNPLPFEASDLPDYREAEPNNSKEEANIVRPPVAIQGHLDKAGDADLFRFKPDRDQRLVLEVHARRFGSPLDALLTLMDAGGNVLQRNDDDAGGTDARIEADFKAGQEYLVSLRDLVDRGGPAFGYRLTLQAPDTTPGFTVTANAGRVRVHAGGHTAVRVEVARRQGLDGIVTVAAENLPPGVSSSPVILDPRGANFGWLILSADATAASGNVPLRLVAAAEHAGRQQKRAVNLPEAGFLTVLPAAPFSLAVAEASVTLEQNSTGGVEVAVARRDGFNGDVKVIAEDFAGLGQPSVNLPGTQARARLGLNAAFNSPGGVRPLLLRAEATVDGASVVEYAAAPVWITTREIPFFVTAMLPGSTSFRSDIVKLSAVALPTGTKSEANQTEFVVKLERRGYVGEIPLQLEGLPAGVTATYGPIAANASEAGVKLLVGDQTAIAKELSFQVLASVTNSDRIFRQRTQPIKLLVQAPEREVAATTNGTPANLPTAPLK